MRVTHNTYCLIKSIHTNVSVFVIYLTWLKKRKVYIFVKVCKPVLKMCIKWSILVCGVEKCVNCSNDSKCTKCVREVPIPLEEEGHMHTECVTEAEAERRRKLGKQDGN